MVHSRVQEILRTHDRTMAPNVGCRLEVKGSRELGFFPGVARGAVYPGFTYQTEAGTIAAPIKYQANPMGFVPSIVAFSCSKSTFLLNKFDSAW